MLKLFILSGMEIVETFYFSFSNKITLFLRDGSNTSCRSGSLRRMMAPTPSGVKITIYTVKETDCVSGRKTIENKFD